MLVKPLGRLPNFNGIEFIRIETPAPGVID
jgi:hypothetical protein